MEPNVYRVLYFSTVHQKWIPACPCLFLCELYAKTKLQEIYMSTDVCSLRLKLQTFRMSPVIYAAWPNDEEWVEIADTAAPPREDGCECPEQVSRFSVACKAF